MRRSFTSEVVNRRPTILNGRFLLQGITGVQRVQREVLDALDQMAACGEIEPPVVILPKRGEIVEAPTLKCIKMERFGRLSGHLWEQIELPKVSRGTSLINLGNTAPLYSLLASNTNVLTMVHDLSYKYFPDAYSWSFKTLYSTLIPVVLRKSDVVVTVSKSEMNAISRHYPFLEGRNEFHFAQNGGLPDRDYRLLQDEAMPKREERGYGIYVGSLSKRKNASGVISTAVAFLREYQEMRFVIIGSGSHVFESLDIEVPADVSGRLEMRGQVNDKDEIYRSYLGARFLLFPSFYEASPLPPIEAMSLGCPVVSSRIPSLEERCGDAAVYCNPSNQDSIISAVRRLMDEPELWDSMSRAGKERASHFSWGEQTRTLLGLVENLQ